MKEKKKNDLAVLFGFAGSYKGLTFLGLGLSAFAMVLGMAPYICIWLVTRDLIAAAPDWTQASGVARYGWMAFGFAAAGIAVYFAALIAHRMRTVEAADKIVVLADGKVAEQGSPDELLTKGNGIFRHMTRLQIASAGWTIK